MIWLGGRAHADGSQPAESDPSGHPAAMNAAIPAAMIDNS